MLIKINSFAFILMSVLKFSRFGVLQHNVSKVSWNNCSALLCFSASFFPLCGGTLHCSSLLKHCSCLWGLCFCHVILFFLRDINLVENTNLTMKQLKLGLLYLIDYLNHQTALSSKGHLYYMSFLLHSVLSKEPTEN